MIRWITILSALLLLSGCVTTREVVYRDRYYDDGYADSRYEDRYYRDGSYYAPPVSGRGDYYYRAPSYAGSAWYWDYPAYYSVFWPLYRSWYDPFFHPGYYYGVTYYPRNYFSIGFSRGWGWGGSLSLFYSPYRYSWVDNYYDWTPWHHHRHRHHTAPRYGSALNEAERLARMGDFGRGHGAAAYSAGGERRSAIDNYGRTRDGARGADYGRVPAPRQEPGFSGFGVRDARSDVRRVGDGTRAAPLEAGVGAPVAGARGGAGSRGADYGDRAPLTREAPITSRGSWSAERVAPNADVRREAGSWNSYPAPRQRYSREGAGREASHDYGRALPRERGYGREAQGDWRSAPREAYVAPSPRGYDTGAPAGYAPVPRAEPRFESRYEARPEPRFEARAEPRYEARPEPRYESRPEPRYESRSESRGGDDGDVRRVGSDREH